MCLRSEILKFLLLTQEFAFAEIFNLKFSEQHQTITKPDFILQTKSLKDILKGA